MEDRFAQRKKKIAEKAKNLDLVEYCEALEMDIDFLEVQLKVALSEMNAFQELNEIESRIDEILISKGLMKPKTKVA